MTGGIIRPSRMTLALPSDFSSDPYSSSSIPMGAANGHATAAVPVKGRRTHYENQHQGDEAGGARQMGAKVHICTLCRRTFRNEEQLEHHTESRHGTTLENIKKMSPEALRAAQTTLPADFTAPATFEGRTTGQNDEIDGEGKFTCSICSKSFRLLHALTVHMQLTHPNGMQGVAPSAPNKPTTGFGLAATFSPAVAVAGPSFADLMAKAKSSPTPASFPGAVAVTAPAAPREPDPFTIPLLSRPIPGPRLNPHLHMMSCNVSVFVGAVDWKGVEQGFVFQDEVAQLRLHCDGALVTVRCFRSYGTDFIVRSIDPGATLLVVGVLRLVPWMDLSKDVVRHSPCVHVMPPMGVVHILKP